MNKYNVVDYHLLIVTREFEEQESLLNLQDFQALGSCMGEFEGLAFYNGGKTAGASQRHKHLQVVPLPMIPSGEKIPIDRAIATAKFNNGIGITSQFPFRHAIAKLDVAWVHSPVESAAEILEFYLTLLKAVGIESRDGINGKQSGHYNLLVTGEWMLVVPRSYEYFQSISVNSLGFAGALLVKNQEQMNIIKEQKPLTILRHVAAG